MGAAEVRAFGGFSLGTFAPRLGKKASCTPGDGYARRAIGTTLQSCFLECLESAECENVLVDYVEIKWMEKPPPLNCTLLGKIVDPATSCKPGTGTLVIKLNQGRPLAG